MGQYLSSYPVLALKEEMFPVYFNNQAYMRSGTKTTGLSKDVSVPSPGRRQIDWFATNCLTGR